jgi:hypothetical protein
MKTSDLVQLLAGDPVVGSPPGRTLARLLLPAMLTAIALFILIAGLRPDLWQRLESPRLVFKIVVNLLLGIAGGGMLLQLSRPQSNPAPWRSGLLAVVALLGVAVLLELAMLPREQWWTAARGQNAAWCLRIIPLLAMAPLVAALWAARQGAPGNPAQAGAAAGLLAAGLGGMLYALHCTDDSPLFVGLWYGLATCMVTAVGAAVGARLLRW